MCQLWDKQPGTEFCLERVVSPFTVRSGSLAEMPGKNRECSGCIAQVWVAPATLPPALTGPWVALLFKPTADLANAVYSRHILGLPVLQSQRAGTTAQWPRPGKRPFMAFLRSRPKGT